ncbi:hypothetical protein F5Y16DRAFT_68162 [Xylariaceae sp. FL0255]|nr:hypothetical protein F5Y16DRAFT_68162 [Xylariaceae sp. FL0255]
MATIKYITSCEGDDFFEPDDQARSPARTLPIVGRARLEPNPTPVSEQKEKDAQKNSGRRRCHGPAIWEALKEEIVSLYLIENMRLVDVIPLMENKYGFSATPKMYKTKLKEWNLFKNNRRRDVANMLFLKQRRAALGKDTTFSRNGKTVDFSGYIRRKGLKPTDLIDGVLPGDLPPTLRAQTPPTPRLARSMDLPDDHTFQEAYWAWSTNSMMLLTRRDESYFQTIENMGAAIHSVVLLTHGCWLFSIGKIEPGGAFCRQAFASINLMLDESSHIAIYQLLAGIVRYPNTQIYQKLWGYLSEYSNLKRGMSQQLRRLVSAFSKLANEQNVQHSVEMAQWGRRCASEHSGSGRFDGMAFDYSLIEPWDVLPMNKSYRHRYYMSQENWIVDEIPSATMPDVMAEEPWNIRADLLLILGNKTAWADPRISAIALKMLEQLCPGSQPQQQYMHFVCLYSLARNNRARCREDTTDWNSDYDLAREYMRRAAEVQKEAWQPGKNYYETLSTLAEWHQEAGYVEEAGMVYRKRDLECQKAFRALLL